MVFALTIGANAKRAGEAGETRAIPHILQLSKHFVPPKGGTPTNVEVLGRWNTKHEHLASMLREQGR